MEKSKMKVRWNILFHSSVLLLASYYCNDIPSAVKSQLHSRFNHISTERYEFLFSLLYTFASIPHIIFPLLGGYLVDEYGIYIVIIGFSLLFSFGHIIFSFGCSVVNFSYMLVGRFLIGLAGGILGVAQGVIVVSWFKGKELAFALGINLSIGRFGTVLNNSLSPYIAGIAGVTYACWFGVVICQISMLSSFVLTYLEKVSTSKSNGEKEVLLQCVDLKESQELEELKKSRESQAIEEGSSEKQSASSDFSIFHFRKDIWLLAASALVVYGSISPFNNIASSLFMERNYFKSPPEVCNRCGTGEYETHTNCSVIAPNCPSAPYFAWPLPLLSANCSIQTPHDQQQCSTSPPWISAHGINCDSIAWKLGEKTSKYCESKQNAARWTTIPMSVPYTMSAFIIPIFGFWIDKLGCKALLVLIAPLILSINHLVIAFHTGSPWIPMIFHGFGYCLFASSIWPCIPYLVDERHVGIAYGVVSAAMNLGFAIVPLLAAVTYDLSNQKYLPNVEILFSSMAFIGVIIGFGINYIDYQNKWILNRPQLK